jgi:hypothetical protein
MLKKTISFEDFNGHQVTEDYYFHLSKAELIEMEVSQKGGLSEMMQRIVTSEDGAQIIAMFKKIVLTAYGIKSEDGRRFIKSPELRDSFEQTEAYSTLFMELATDGKAAGDFVNGIVPADLLTEETATTAPNPNQIAIPKKEDATLITAAGTKNTSDMTREELLAMLNQK